MRKTLDWLKNAWIWIKSWFITYHKVTVSYNAIYGDADDQVFENVPKIITEKEKVLVFIDEDGRRVKFAGADGLMYKIEEQD
jgi:hypothetical protein